MAKERELDVLVASEIIGNDIIRQKKGGIKERTLLGHIRPLRAYSTEVTAAWEVVQKLHITLLPISDNAWFAMAGNEWKSPAEFFEYLQRADFVSSGAAVAATMPMAVCLAALKAAEKRTGIRLISPESPSEILETTSRKSERSPAENSVH